VSRHAFLAHTNPLQGVVFPVGLHMPIPSHVRSTTLVLSSLHALQPVPLGATLQWPAPSHLPVVPHAFMDVSSEQVSASLRSSPTFAHVPLALPQVWHVPQEGDEQQVLSTQLPLPHSLPVVQWAPRALLPQLPVATSHALSEMQSASEVQVVLQALATGSHLKLPQLCVSPGGQAPLPSHFAAIVTIVALAGQLAARHVVLVPHLRQPPPPLQNPSLPQVDSGEAVQPPPSSALPAAMSLHMPRAVPSAHVLHTPAHSFSQHTLSTQKLDRHSSRSLQLAPLSLRPQRPISHCRPGMHWLLSLHEPKHAVPPGLHTNGAHGDVAPAVHTPEALQVEGAVNVPFAHVAAAQVVPAGYLRQPPMPLQKPSLPQLAGP
jgi:hypothetical protein